MNSRISKVWYVILLIGVLFTAELFFAFRWDVRNKQLIYGLFILDQTKPLAHFYIAVLISLLAVALSFKMSDLNGYIRTGIVLAFLMPLPSAYLGSYSRISHYEHVTSSNIQGHVYHLSYLELSGQYYALYQCDRISFLCHEVDYFPASGITQPYDVTIFTGSDSDTLCIGNEPYAIRQYSITENKGRWPDED